MAAFADLFLVELISCPFSIELSKHLYEYLGIWNTKRCMALGHFVGSTVVTVSGAPVHRKPGLVAMCS